MTKKSSSVEHERATVAPDPTNMFDGDEAEPMPAPEPARDPALPPRTASGRIHYVICQHGTQAAAAKTGAVPSTARLVEQVPLMRLTEECQVSALVRGKVTEPIDALKFWDGAHERIYSGPFLSALGKTCAPLAVRVRDGVLTLRWA